MRFTKKAAVISFAFVLALSGCGNSVETSSASSTTAESVLNSSNNDASSSEAAIDSTPHDEIINKRSTGGVASAPTAENISSGESAAVNSKYQDIAEKSAKIIASIERENINALVNVSLIDFTLDGVPEVVVSYDTGSGHSYVENDVYELQSENCGKIFSFRASGISRDYAPSIFLYEGAGNERSFAFNYGLDAGNYLKSDFIDKLELADGKYIVSNIFSSTIATEPAESLYSINGNETDRVSFEQRKSEWLSDLRECEFCRVEVPIKAAEWNDENALMKRFENAFAEFESKSN